MIITWFVSLDICDWSATCLSVTSCLLNEGPLEHKKGKSKARESDLYLVE